MIRVIFNQKGGVGKTSIAVNLAAAFAHAGRRTLVLDLDTQGNATQYLLGENPSSHESIGDFFAGTLHLKMFKDSLTRTICKTEFPRLSVIAADPKLAELQPKLESRYKIFKLQQALTEMQESFAFDEVVIDTPPALNFYTMSALLACDRVLIPFDCDAFSAQAVAQVVDLVEEVATDHNKDIAVEGVVINQFQSTAKLPAQTIQTLVASGYPILRPYLSPSVLVRESRAAHKPLVWYRPQHKLSLDFIELAKSLVTPKARGKSASGKGSDTPKAPTLKAKKGRPLDL